MNKDPLEYYIDLVAAKVRKPFCLVIGAMDGITFDTLGPRIQKDQWPAVMVEPNPIEFKKLKKNFAKNKNVKCIQKAVHDQEKIFIPLMYVNPLLYKDDPSREWMRGISTLNAEVGDITSISPGDLFKTFVQPITMDSLLKDVSTTIDILQIDTEGYDSKILFQFPFNRWKPALIIMEFLHITVTEFRQSVNALKSLGYKVSEIGNDLVATQGI